MHLVFLNCWVTNSYQRVTSDQSVHLYGTHSFDPRILEFTHLFKKPRSTIAKGEHDDESFSSSDHQIVARQGSSDLSSAGTDW